LLTVFISLPIFSKNVALSGGIQIGSGEPLFSKSERKGSFDILSGKNI
jgi:hypothetical protein